MDDPIHMNIWIKLIGLSELINHKGWTPNLVRRKSEESYGLTEGIIGVDVINIPCIYLQNFHRIKIKIPYFILNKSLKWSKDLNLRPKH